MPTNPPTTLPKSLLVSTHPTIPKTTYQDGLREGARFWIHQIEKQAVKKTDEAMKRIEGIAQ